MKISLRTLPVLLGVLLASLTLSMGYARQSAAQDQTTIMLGETSVGVAQSQVIEARIQCAGEDCRTFSATINFDPAMLRVDSAELGPFLGNQTFVGENTVDNVAGKIRLVAAALENLPIDADNVLFGYM